MLDAIMFDLDGTLLPMVYEEFMHGYLGLLSNAVAKYGYTKERLLGSMWKGVGAMIANDGSRTNKEVFWDVFFGLLGSDSYGDIPKFDEFYSNDFHKAKQYTKPTVLAKTAVDIAKTKANKVVLATNPFFPRVAVASRLEWCGLKESDFDYITDYENSSFCKPNPKYFEQMAEKLSIDLSNSLMVGNNMQEDIAASAAASMKTYLITDCLIDDGEGVDTPSGSFEDFLNFLKNL